MREFLIKSASIKTAFFVSVVAVLFPQLAFATTPSFSCSSNLVVSLDNGYQASCDGDFSFTDGVLQNDVSINLKAGGFLSVGENATLSAPIINLISKDIFVNGMLDAPNGIVTLSSTGSTVLTNTAQINVASQVNVSNQAPIQTKPQLVVNWEQFQISPGSNIQFASNTNVPSVVIDRVGGAITLVPNSGVLTIQADAGDKVNLLVTQVPEPSAYAMMILGLASISLSRKRKID
ncbi:MULTISPECIES: PEP-CTERM sorting domain-containing protein [Methylotenera]|uniref:PEP-CTERM sorting domain-containing protein n=1 Tax=Methylotenera TaxID=359407 RepID=UPI0003777911|nr:MULTISPECIES: PEP-CTERM sorting domain-containing protein [Methylotenera]